jgi:hypothetical protein
MSMPMEAAVLSTVMTIGTSTLTRAIDPYRYLGVPQWQEPAADPIADALAAAGECASHVSDGAVAAARAVLNLLADLPGSPTVAVEDNEITLEWYKDKSHVAVVAVDGQSISWAAVAGSAPAMKGKEPFANQLSDEAFSAINTAAG